MYARKDKIHDLRIDRFRIIAIYRLELSYLYEGYTIKALMGFYF
jgi:hypothetical protein